MNRCAGCGRPILDRFLLNVLDQAWHARCVQCADCNSSLNERCFSRDGKLYCKNDFVRRYGTKCAGCSMGISPSDLVRRARNRVFHLKCFTCLVCRKQLSTGEELYVLDENKFICKEDYMKNHHTGECTMVCPGSDVEDVEDMDLECNLNENPNSVISEKDAFIDDDCASRDGSVSEIQIPASQEICGSPANSAPTTQADSPSREGGNSASNNSSNKENEQNNENNNSNVEGRTETTMGAKRRGPRTTIKAKQLETLKAAFAATPKPTRHIREQLAQETGLNMRVIQVWFQNRRSKERRMKQLSALGARRHFFRNPRRMRALRAGMSPHDLEDNHDVLANPPYGYFPESQADFYQGYQAYGEFFHNQAPGEHGHLAFLTPGGSIETGIDGQYIPHREVVVNSNSSPEPISTMPISSQHDGHFVNNIPSRNQFGHMLHPSPDLPVDTW